MAHTITIDGLKCAKYLLFAFNFLFVIGGISLIVAGAVVNAHIISELVVFLQSLLSAAILLICIGVFIFFISFLGCYGALKENYCMVLTYAVSLGIIFILEMAGAITGYVMEKQIEDFIHQIMYSDLENYGRSAHTDMTNAWDDTQTSLKCCGTDNYTDWTNSGANLSPNSVPDSCCKQVSPHCGLSQADKSVEEASKVVYITGCIQQLEGQVLWNAFIIGGAGFTLALLQLLGLASALYIIYEIRKGYKFI